MAIWLYHEKEGSKLFKTEGDAEIAMENGWVDTPEKFNKKYDTGPQQDPELFWLEPEREEPEIKAIYHDPVTEPDPTVEPEPVTDPDPVIEQDQVIEDKDIIETDVTGLPWDGRIHVRTKSKNDSGKWNYKRGISDDTVAEVETELRAMFPVTE